MKALSYSRTAQRQTFAKEQNVSARVVGTPVCARTQKTSYGAQSVERKVLSVRCTPPEDHAVGVFPLHVSCQTPSASKAEISSMPVDSTNWSCSLDSSSITQLCPHRLVKWRCRYPFPRTTLSSATLAKANSNSFARDGPGLIPTTSPSYPLGLTHLSSSVQLTH